MKRICVKNLVVLILFGVFIYSCQSDEKIDIKNLIESDVNFVSIDEVSDVATKIEFSKRGNLKDASSNETVSKVIEKITEVPDENGKTSYYIINYEENGFIIISADKRVNPILAFSESGGFPLNLTEYPNGLVDWLVKTKDYIVDVRKKKTKQSKNMTLAWSLTRIQSFINSNETSSSTTKREEMPDPDDCVNTREIVGPLLQTAWAQGSGYNNLVPHSGCSNYANGRAPTGCVATAMSQIIRYHQYPNNYNYSIMLDTIRSWEYNSSGANEIAKLMRDVGSAVNMDYSCSSSSADTESEVASSFKNDFGYSSASYADYNYNTVVSNIRNGNPVILRGGRNTGWWIFGVYSDGHAWVCDGIRKTFFCDTGNSYLSLHMNWGWNNNNNLNGWFSFNNWNPGDHTFNYKRGMVYNIYP
jgi:hypothetical protein